MLVHRYIVFPSNPINFPVKLSLELFNQEIVKRECTLHDLFDLGHHLSFLLT